MLRLRLMANDDKEVCKGDTIIGTAPAGREKLFLTGHKGGSSSVAKAGRLGSYNRATEGHHRSSSGHASRLAATPRTLEESLGGSYGCYASRRLAVVPPQLNELN